MTQTPHFLQFASRHLALQACLEVLGTRIAPHPVIIPVTAPTEVLSAILRAGGIPFPVDVDPIDAQMGRQALKDALAELESAVVLFCTYGVMEVDQELLDIAKDQITIGIHDRGVKYGCTVDSHCTFELYKCYILNTANYIYTQYDKQIEELRIVRDGELGLYAGNVDMYAAREFTLDFEGKIHKPFRDNLIVPCFPVDGTLGYYPIRIKDKANQILVSLQEISKWYTCYRPMTPLYDYQVIKDRWPKENASFPVAESIKNDFLFFQYQSSWSPKHMQEIINTVVDFL